jgi:hypothetical protein
MFKNSLQNKISDIHFIPLPVINEYEDNYSDLDFNLQSEDSAELDGVATLNQLGDGTTE